MVQKHIISREEYRQHGNLVYKFVLGDRVIYEYSIKNITEYFNNQRVQFLTRLQQLQETFQRSLRLDMAMRKSSILQQQRQLNQIIVDMNFVNDRFLTLIYEDISPQ